MSRNDRVLAGIVTHNPDPDRLADNLAAIAPQVAAVTVFDNGSNNVESVGELADRYGATLLVSPENRGIAYALNRLFEWGAGEFCWLLTLDQDSVCPSTMVAELMEQAMIVGAGVVSPFISYRDNQAFQTRPDVDMEPIQWCITSGALTNIESWRSVGGFDEWLFIDSVDYDFCLRMVAAGSTIWRVNGVTLLHQLGDLRCRRMLGRTVYVTNHSATRKYYQSRNRIYLQAKLGTSAAQCLTKSATEFGKVLLFEDERQPKLAAMLRGVRDGIHARRAILSERTR